ncbi:unnamed protein product, partial [Mesorhabditis belari]|uniref:BTB domain-containing protein n=1 Tax=Mesorhabditis belari TaxID=2138241 RepID=A0AAF3F1S4_9BILA
MCTVYRTVLLSNGGHYLGNLLASRLEKTNESDEEKAGNAEKTDKLREENAKMANEVIQVLDTMTNYSVVDCGRQLALSGCGKRLLDLFVEKDLKGGRLLVMRLCKGSTHFRDALGEAKMVDTVLASGLSPSELAPLLIPFSQDAWGRAKLRESGALDLLIEHLASTENLQELVSLISSFRHYAHDRAGLSHLCRNPLFMNTTVKHITTYLKKQDDSCKPSMNDEEEDFRPNSPLLLEIENKLSTRHKKIENPSFSPWSHEGSPYTSHSSPKQNSDTISSAIEFSPSSSAACSPYSPYSSPASSGSLSPYSCSFHSPGRSYSFPNLEELHCSSDYEGALKQFGDSAKQDKLDEDTLQKQLIEGELSLWSWQSQDDGNIPFLVREDLVICLIDYIRHAPNNYARMGKTLKRIASNRLKVGQLLAMHFHVRVMYAFCFTPCRVTRRARRCFKCERTNEIGREVLREFARHVDSEFGREALSRLSNDTKELEVSSKTATVLFVRKNIYNSTPNIEPLLQMLEGILAVEDFDAGGPSYLDGPPIIWQLIATLSVLIPSTVFRDVFEIDAKWEPPENVECQIKNGKDGEDQDEENYIGFVEPNGKLIAKVRLENLCENSEYFMGMFSTDLIEKVTGVRELTFSEEKEGCSREVFVIFLHLLSGCRNSVCANVSSAEICASLIQLSDRYLSPSIMKYLCLPHGPARRLLDGSTLPVFLQAALYLSENSKLIDLCFLTLIKLSKADEIVAALRVASSNKRLLPTFLDYLRDFVKNYSNFKSLTRLTS